MPANPQDEQLHSSNQGRLASTDYSIVDFASHMDMPPEDLENLFMTFIEEFDSELSDLKAAHEINDHKRMYSIAHNIKGIAANMEMDDLFKSCKLLNDLLKDDDIQLSSHLTLIGEIECKYNQTKDILLDFYHVLKD